MATRISNVVVRRVVIVLCIAAPLLVSYARLYRGAHHVSDVVWGIINGVVCALLAWNYLRREPASGTATGVEASGETAQTRA
jgi:undecaprenyl-diphosphatase